MKCPVCCEEATCDEIDIGVGVQQCGPYGCESCGWVQPMPNYGQDDGAYEWNDSVNKEEPK